MPVNILCLSRLYVLSQHIAAGRADFSKQERGSIRDGADAPTMAGIPSAPKTRGA